ncbi:uncharacterized protein B0I36DRAFT_381262 [Microdochium trichocladiopsis]|uniref:Erythromycin esterase n=1 Tax=Microdochium trichocladiopsis TaxID=1682393 RepID=A0A9P9BUJ2_9PEZI|nr:uncharacterized protein B0I36DRAFT_381262 [Microdochium trichocladiopsis]KAH7038202.1 hypothetical protein B0I36DRAFT_381262 [Microdochium trichocladiopsis]
MATPHRRSARIASASLNRSTASPAPRLGSVFEADEATMDKPAAQSLDAIMSSPAPHQPSTPAAATPVKLAPSEMHPSRYQPTTAPPSSGLKLGFVDIEKRQGIAATHATPSKSRVPSSDFTFRTPRPGYDGELGPEARRMMEALREEAAAIKAKLKEERDEERAKGNDGRVIARAKGKAGRFSEVHMAEFKKMDSIANHPSAFRADPSRITPIKPAMKRSQAAANLDEPESAKQKISAQRSIRKVPSKQMDEPESPTKRVRQRIEDDASSLRPVSRDGSNIPRPKSSGMDSPRGAAPRNQTLPHLTTPTRSTLARLQACKTPTITLVKSPSKTELSAKPGEKTLARSPSKSSLASVSKASTKPETGSLVRTPSKSSITGILKAPNKTGLSFMKSAATSKLPAAANPPTYIQTPGRFDKMKSILKRTVSGSSKPPKTGMTYSATSPSKIHGRQHFVDRPLQPVPLATPKAKFAISVASERRVNFTPDTKGAAVDQNSPSPIKSALPRAAPIAQPAFTRTSPVKSEARQLFKPQKEKADEEVSYPDLSAYEVPEEQDVSAGSPSTKRQILSPLPPSVPGTFTFRSDHTIQFDTPPVQGFGGSVGQSSVRQVVRESSFMPTARMPGAFPRSLGMSVNKENTDPKVQKMPLPPVAHGLSNKKRHRADSEEDEEIDEGVQRGAKKLRKTPKVEGHAIVAPRMISSPSPAKSLVKKQAVTPASQQKKKAGMSLSRLHMLAQPKMRK